ncbi:NAD dependent epimerase/dehydratase family protein [Hyaloraphidium curvatum]|nr:NAD dependent epimerase/dehydratase family protein [Hyaloraphidium curvatum]
MQTVLGAGGSVGVELARVLPSYTDRVRLCARNPKPVAGNEELVKTDLLSAADVDRAVAGSDVVYLVAGLEYKASVWEAQWPVVMRNVLDACAKHKAKLVFYDNVYMYDPERVGRMTEDTPWNPSSRKGKVRAQIARQLLDEAAAGKVTALIARAADFASLKNSALGIAVVDAMAKGQTVRWLGDPAKAHNYTYVPQSAEATALLGNTPDAYGQVWHLPSTKAGMTGKDWVEVFAKEFGVPPKFSGVPKWMMTALAFVSPFFGESKEMAYQYYNDYFFDSAKFEKRFGIKGTEPAQIAKELAAAARAQPK